MSATPFTFWSIADYVDNASDPRQSYQNYAGRCETTATFPYCYNS